MIAKTTYRKNSSYLFCKFVTINKKKKHRKLHTKLTTVVCNVPKEIENHKRSTLQALFPLETPVFDSTTNLSVFLAGPQPSKVSMPCRHNGRSPSHTHLSEVEGPHSKSQLYHTLTFQQVTYLHWCLFPNVKNKDSST